MVAPTAHFHHPHNTFSQATMFLQSLHTINNDMPRAVSSGPTLRFSGWSWNEMVILTWGGFQRIGLYFSSWCIPRARRHIHAGIWGRRKKKERKRDVEKKSRILSLFFFYCELPSFVLLPFFSLPPLRRRRDVTLLRSLPQMDMIYINNPLRFREHLIDVSLSKDLSQAFE